MVRGVSRSGYETSMKALLGAVLLLAAAPQQPSVPHGFTIERIATVAEARELAIAPNGDLFVGTYGHDVMLVRNAEAAHPTAPAVFAHFDEAPAAGVALSADALFVGTEFAVYRIAYHAGETRAPAPQKLATVRPSGIARDHETTSVAWNGRTLYASIGSSCNACRPELDATRATIQRVDVAHYRLSPVATHIRNAIALTVNPATRALWAGVAGVDDLAVGHPYEIFDDVTAHKLPVSYGWPRCYENRKADPRWPGSCAGVAIPRVIFPAYETPIGAVFYPANQRGRYAFPAKYRGGAFVTLHGSWHGPAQGLSGFVPPRVVFVPMLRDEPARPIDWRDPSKQWTQFVGGYQNGGTNERIGRPTGIAVGPEGSLFVADDETGAIYRIRKL